MLALCVLVPPHYPTPEGPPPHRLHAIVTRMLPFRDLLHRRGVTLLQGEHAGEVGLYVGKNHWCRPLPYSFLDGWKRDTPLESFLAREKVDLFYLDEGLLRTLEAEKSPGARPFLSPAGPPGWELVGAGDAPGDRWRLFRRRGTRPRPSTPYGGVSLLPSLFRRAERRGHGGEGPPPVAPEQLDHVVHSLRLSGGLARLTKAQVENIVYALRAAGHLGQFRDVASSSYDDGHLISFHNADFLKDPRFAEAHRLGQATNSWQGFDVRWHVHVLCWAAAHGKALGAISSSAG
jgi:hypothetical protein